MKRLFDKAFPGQDRKARQQDLLQRFHSGLSDKEAKFQVEYVKNPPDIDSAVDELVNFMEIRKIQGKTTTQISSKVVRFENSNSYADEEKAKTKLETPCTNPSPEKVVRNDNSFTNTAPDSALVSVFKELEALRKELHDLRTSRLCCKEEHQRNPMQNLSGNLNQSQNQFRSSNKKYRGQNFIHGFRKNRYHQNYQNNPHNNANVQSGFNSNFKQYDY